MKTILCDIEVYPNCFLVGMQQVESGKILILEESDREEINRDRLRKILLSHKFIGFNSMGYDAPMLWLFLSGASLQQMKQANDRIIKGRIKWWDVENAL